MSEPAPTSVPVTDAPAGETAAAGTAFTGTAAPAADRPGPMPAGSTGLDAAVAGLLKRDGTGLVAAIIQQFDTHEVLMLGWMDDEALRRTLSSGRVTFYSRSRSEYWRKGDTSGNVQYVKTVALDCDGDALLVRVDQVGAACHTGTRTCFDGRPLAAVEGSSVEGPAVEGSSVEGPAVEGPAAEGPAAEGPAAG